VHLLNIVKAFRLEWAKPIDANPQTVRSKFLRRHANYRKSGTWRCMQNGRILHDIAHFCSSRDARHQHDSAVRLRERKAAVPVEATLRRLLTCSANKHCLNVKQHQHVAGNAPAKMTPPTGKSSLTA
jgi:hypothetical protein